MNRYYYDLHIHSCLSPCADNGNTPHDLAGMGVLAGLQIMALTDHNTWPQLVRLSAGRRRRRESFPCRGWS